jgi:NAD dependent epimerase/dehydratase family enzyme
MATMALDGQHVIPRVAQEAGHEWAFADVEPALRHLLG